MRRSHALLPAVGALVASLLPVTALASAPAAADTTRQPLPLAQDWSNPELITISDSWAAVPGIEGFRGDGMASSGADPQGITADGASTPLDVIANQTNVSLSTGGIAEFDLADDVVALQGSGTADAPHLVLHLDATGQAAVTVSYVLRDIDSTADDATQRVALQYRTGGTGPYTNVPSAYVGDASGGPSQATLVTPVSAQLPAAADGASALDVRIITADAASSDEWIGVDDITVTGTPIGDDQPVSIDCGPALVVVEDQGAVRQVTATDPDDTVTDIAITGVTPAPGAGGVTRTAVTPAAGDGGTAEAVIAVDPATPAGPYDVQLTATNDDGPPQTATCTIDVTISDLLTIGEVQGAVADGDDPHTHRSPFPNGTLVSVRGVITQKVISRTSSGASNYGFFLQSPPSFADGDPTSSDGVFVYTSTFTDLIGGDVPTVGDDVVLSARVTEFFNLTELTGASLVQVVRTGVDLAAETPAFETAPPDDLLDAGRYWERREGMQAAIPNGSVVQNGRNVFPSTADGEVWVIRPDHPLAERSDPYARRVFRDFHPLDDDPAVPFDDGNGMRILMGSLGIKQTAGSNTALIDPARTFDTLDGPAQGGVYYSFGKWSVQVAGAAFEAGADPALNAPPAPADPATEWTAATFNVENLYDYRDDPTDGCDFGDDGGCPGVSPPFDYVPASDAVYQTRLDEQAAQIAGPLHAPDLLLVQEAEDQDICQVTAGALDCTAGDGKPDTLQELALNIADIAGAPTYDAVYDRDGADDRGIVSAFLFRTDRVELLPAAADDPVLGSAPTVDYRGAALTTNADVQNPKALNADLPSDVDTSTGVDGSEVFTRAPQVGLFRVGGADGVVVYAVSNHFSSGPDGRIGQRTEQAAYNAAIAEAIEADDAANRVIVGGDLNVFPRPDDPVNPPSDQLGPLYDEAGLTNLFDRLVAEVPASAYGYVFQGQAQTLDQLFVDDTLDGEHVQVRVAHINADFPADQPGDGPRGTSDHDPSVVRFELPTAEPPPPTLALGDATVTESRTGYVKAHIPVVLTEAAASDTLVIVSMPPTPDAEIIDPQVVVPAGSTTGYAVIRVFPSVVVEFEETFTVTATSPYGDTTGTLTIRDAAPAGPTSLSIGDTRIPEPGTPARLTITLAKGRSVATPIEVSVGGEPLTVTIPAHRTTTRVPVPVGDGPVEVTITSAPVAIADGTGVVTR